MCCNLAIEGDEGAVHWTISALLAISFGGPQDRVLAFTAASSFFGFSLLINDFTPLIQKLAANTNLLPNPINTVDLFPPKTEESKTVCWTLIFWDSDNSFNGSRLGIDLRFALLDPLFP